jgi:hypothetical protein
MTRSLNPVITTICVSPSLSTEGFCCPLQPQGDASLIKGTSSLVFVAENIILPQKYKFKDKALLGPERHKVNFTESSSWSFEVWFVSFVMVFHIPMAPTNFWHGVKFLLSQLPLFIHLLKYDQELLYLNVSYKKAGNSNSLFRRKIPLQELISFW